MQGMWGKRPREIPGLQQDCSSTSTKIPMYTENKKGKRNKGMNIINDKIKE